MSGPGTQTTAPPESGTVAATDVVETVRPVYREGLAVTSESPDADSVYFVLRHAVEHVPFDMLARTVCGGDWCEDWFPCPRCQASSPVPECSAHGDAFHWECLHCGTTGSRRTLENVLLDSITTVDDAAELLAAIKAVTA